MKTYLNFEEIPKHSFEENLGASDTASLLPNRQQNFHAL